ncbi:MAG: hypothetical protein KAI83_15815 [Thiomargarita sp.]|nr:hypothetical protein [Thiomargarita sp.]
MESIRGFSFGRILESNPLDLDVFWSPNFQIWTFFGVQRFSFGHPFEASYLHK